MLRALAQASRPLLPRLGLRGVAAVSSKFVIYKSKAALAVCMNVLMGLLSVDELCVPLQVRPFPPVFSKVGTNTYAMKRKGTFLFEFAPAVGQKQYDWTQNLVCLCLCLWVGGLSCMTHASTQRFALSAVEAGNFFLDFGERVCGGVHMHRMDSSLIACLCLSHTPLPLQVSFVHDPSTRNAEGPLKTFTLSKAPPAFFIKYTVRVWGCPSCSVCPSH
jgi:hypothetical protein